MSRFARDLLALNENGLFCEQGGFYIDPWRSVDRAVITHAHSDHARWGMKSYMCARPGAAVLRMRIGDEAPIKKVAYGEVVTLNGVHVSLHPAGHILGSAQVRVEYEGQVVVVSGDYKLEPDITCAAFEPLKCHTFVSETTFGLPIYRWPDQAGVIDEIHRWWKRNQEAGKCSLLLGYALGKCQRALARLDPEVGPILLHGAVNNMTDAYRSEGIPLPPTRHAATAEKGFDFTKAIVLAPPSANGSTWIRRFGDHSTAFMSGWMAIRGARRRRAVDRGFVISDHIDWPSLLTAVAATEAESVWLTHGYSNVVARFLAEKGLETRVLSTSWEGEAGEAETDTAEEKAE